MIATRNRTVWLALLACVTPSLAQASNFSVLLYFLYGVCAVVALLLALLAYHSARAVQSRAARAFIWGLWAALVLTPLSVEGGNGTLAGTPLLAFASIIFGADPVYITTAFKVLLVSAPVCTVIIWWVQRLWTSAAEQDEQAGGDD